MSKKTNLSSVEPLFKKGDDFKLTRQSYKKRVHMKKMISLALVICILTSFSVVLSACIKDSEKTYIQTNSDIINDSEDVNTKDNNKIYLTKENASTYLSIAAKTYGTLSSKNGDYTYVKSTLSITSASSHFLYYDVVITIVISGYMTIKSSLYYYSQKLECHLNVGGNGSSSNEEMVGILSDGAGWTTNYVKGLGYSIESITGYIEKM